MNICGRRSGRGVYCFHLSPHHKLPADSFTTVIGLTHQPFDRIDRFFRRVHACRFAGSPILRSPFSTKATIEGVVLLPSLLGMTTGSLPSITDTQELCAAIYTNNFSHSILIFKVLKFISDKQFLSMIMPFAQNRPCLQFWHNSVNERPGCVIIYDKTTACHVWNMHIFHVHLYRNGRCPFPCRGKPIIP